MIRSSCSSKINQDTNSISDKYQRIKIDIYYVWLMVQSIEDTIQHLTDIFRSTKWSFDTLISKKNRTNVPDFFLSFLIYTKCTYRGRLVSIISKLLPNVRSVICHFLTLCILIKKNKLVGCCCVKLYRIF